jgi:hypothetical protein
MLTPENFLDQQPQFHLDESGQPISWAIGSDVLRFIGGLLKPGARTLETGSGVSTVYLTLLGCEHIAISPDPREFQRICLFCEKHGVSLDSVSLIEGRSELELPQLDLVPLDLVLIDGRHGFPSPFIDWFYSAISLKVSGYMVVDDIQLLTGKMLQEFLAEDSHWRAVKVFPKTAVFQKLDHDVHQDEWNHQPYMMNRL